MTTYLLYCNEDPRADRLVAHVEEEYQKALLSAPFNLTPRSKLLPERQYHPLRIPLDPMTHATIEEELKGGLSLEATLRSLEASPCIYLTPIDGVMGVLDDDSDVPLFLREVFYRSRLKRGEQPASFFSSESWSEASNLLDKYGAAVITGFLGKSAALDLADKALEGPGTGGREEEMWSGGRSKLGAGRGDDAHLPDDLPEPLLSVLDDFVRFLQEQPLSRTSDRLALCEYRSWPMLASYPQGSRFVWHLDNRRGDSKKGNGRVLTCVYYLNDGWSQSCGGCLRLLLPSGHSQELSTSERISLASAAATSSDFSLLVDVQPLLDTLVDGPPPSNTAHPATAPTRPRRQQPRTPAPTPELSATQKWWAAFMGDRAFVRARAEGKNATEAGHARAKAGADIALSLPAEYGD